MSTTLKSPPSTAAMTGYFQQAIDGIDHKHHQKSWAKTPERAAQAFQELTSGYQLCPLDILKSGLIKSTCQDMVMIQDIQMSSLCEHHLLPFIGQCHLAYLPQGHIVGLSKLPALVSAFSKRLQLQEHLTEQIAQTIDEVLKPRGVIVLIKAQHTCMSMRGSCKQNSTFVTTATTGEFQHNAALRQQFIQLTHQ